VGDQVKRRGGGDEIGEVVGADGDLVSIFIDGRTIPTPSDAWEVVEVISPL
jgi:hypothetical protein